jgi:hypothetical protein
VSIVADAGAELLPCWLVLVAGIREPISGPILIRIAASRIDMDQGEAILVCATGGIL